MKRCLAITFIFVASYILFCVNMARAAKSESANMPDSIKHEVLAFELEGLTDKGDKKWEVSGQSAVAVSPTEVKMNDITAKAFGDEAQATITADRGVYDKAKNNVRLEQNVNAVIESTKKSGGDYLDFSSTIEAAGDRKNTREVQSGGTKKTKTVITCDGEVEFDYAENRAYFNKNVRVVSDSGNIEADKITIYLEPATKKIKEIAAEGNVKIIKGENITYSEKATYVEAQKKIILTGRPKLVIYQEGEAFDADFLGKK